MVLLLLLLVLQTVSGKQDCVPGQWEEWSSCTETCGPTGTRSRNRKIAILPTADGVQCNSMNFGEIIACNRICMNGGMLLSTKCDCKSGYTGVCCELDVDECANANGGCPQKCVNDIGSYSCQCFDGFEMNDEKLSCVDINECSTSNGGCDRLCMNYPGGYSCGCIPPQILEIDGKSCAKENYCVTNSDAFNCSDHCVIHNNQFKCDCPEGYKLDKKDFQCVDINECVGGYFCSGGTCINTNGTAYCECGSGRGLDADGMKCIDVDECKPGFNQCSHTCVNRHAGHACLCPAGMVIGTDHKTCEDENECLRDEPPCSHKCKDLIGTFACLCPEDMELEHDNRTCCEIGKCIRPLSAEGKTTGSEKLVITFSILAVIAVLVLVIVVWRLLKRNLSTSEKVLRSLTLDDAQDVYYNRNADSMELETRGLGLAATASRAEHYQTFQRKNVKNYGADDDDTYQSTKDM